MSVDSFLELLRTGGARLPQPPACSPDLYDLMLRCWSHLPEDRPQWRPILAALENLFPHEGEG